MYNMLYNEYMPNRSIRGISLKNWTWLKVAAIEKHTTMGDLLNQILDEHRKGSGATKLRVQQREHYDGDDDGCYEMDGMLYKRS
jgi:hypothetical protein